MIFNLALLYNSGPLQFIVFCMMNLWCRSRLIKKLRQDTWTFLRDEAQAAVILLGGFDTLQWCLSILLRPRLPAAATLYIWMHALCFAPHLDSLSSALIGFLFHITSRLNLAEALKHLSAIDSVSLFICLGCQGWISGKLFEWWNICSMNSFWKCGKKNTQA